MKKKHSYYLYSWLIMITSLILSLSITKDDLMVNHVLFSFANLVVYLLTIISWCKLGGRLLSMYVFFVLYAFFCNAGQSVLYSLGLQDTIMYTYMHESIADITRMLRFQLLCVAALNLGACHYMSKHTIISFKDMLNFYNNRNRAINRYDRTLDFLMYLSFASIAITCINMVIMRQSMNYLDYFASGRGGTTVFFSELFDILSIILPIRCLFLKRHVKFVYAFYFFFICIFMLVGSRGLAIRYLAITMMCLPMTNPQLFRKKLIWIWFLAVTFGFAGLSVISASRSSTLSVSNFDLSNSLSMSLLNTMDEMGNSERPAVVAMNAVDESLGNKQTFLYTIICGFIPFTSSLSFFQEQYIYLGDTLTELVGSFSGLGSSYIGECYLNYGWFGWLFMLFYGYVVAYGENEANKRILNGNILIALFIFAILSRQVAFGRSEFIRLAPLFRWIEIIFLVTLFCRTKKT